MKIDEILKEYVYIVLQSDNIHFLTIRGQAGLGKSFNVAKILKEMGCEEDVHFKVLSGHVTPKRLFEILGKVRTLEPPKLIVIDDLDALLRSKISISILKGALINFNNKRIVSYESTRNNREEQSFEFDGKMILIVNNLPQSYDIDPILDRGIVFKYEFNPKELVNYIEKEVLPSYDLNKTETNEVWSKVKQFVSSPKFSIRMLNRAVSFYRHDKKKWGELWLKSINK